jgi:hypothetical protein
VCAPARAQPALAWQLNRSQGFLRARARWRPQACTAGREMNGHWQTRPTASLPVAHPSRAQMSWRVRPRGRCGAHMAPCAPAIISAARARVPAAPRALTSGFGNACRRVCPNAALAAACARATCRTAGVALGAWWPQRPPRCSLPGPPAGATTCWPAPGRFMCDDTPASLAARVGFLPSITGSTPSL